MAVTEQLILALEQRGFNVSEDGRVSCDQCAALVINGMATHELGCPNQKGQCRECGGTAESRHARLCKECFEGEAV
jgi:hypothetical protein